MSSEERRLHPVGMLIGAIKTTRRWVGAAVFPGIAFLLSQGFSLWTIALVALGALVVAALAAFWGFLSWRATTYAVSDSAFLLRTGVLQKNERTIPLEHVQSVDTVQGVIQRAFGVFEVRVETAGGGAGEPDASLPALDRQAVEVLRREIEGSRREPVEAGEEAGPEVLRRLSTRDLLVAGATSGQIGIALSLLAVGSQVFDDVLPEGFVRNLIDALAPRSVTVVLALVLVVAIFAWLLAIAGTVLAYAGFTLFRDGDFLYIKRGLLERREATIPLARIQAVKISEGILRQPFGLASLRVESAGYGENAGVSTTLFPLLPRKEAHGLLLRAAPEFAVAPELDVLPRRALRRYVFRATIPALVAFGAAAGVSFFVFESTLGLLGLVLIASAVPYGWLSYRDAGWAFEQDRLVVRLRSLARVTTIAPRRRLQSREVSRSPFQSRLRLATFSVQVASGAGGAAVQVVDLEAGAAEALAGDLGPGSRRPATT